MRLSNSPIVFFLLLFFVVPSEAKIFRNAYVSFELPPKWTCALEQTEYVCRSTYSQQAREAIIILTAKEVGAEDSLPQYQSHLEKPKTIVGRKSKPLQSKKINLKVRKIADHPWVDGMHLHGEVENYYTRYLATVKDRIGILVTFSAHKLHYTRYSSDFFRAIQSLKVVADKNLMDKPATGPIRPGHETLGQPIAQHMEGLADFDEYPEESGTDTSTTQFILAAAILLAALGAYMYLKKRKKG